MVIIMKKNLFFIFFVLAVVLFPISVQAENKIYFETDSINIAPGKTKKVNIIVDSDEDFTKVNFNLITTSNNISFYSVEFNEDFVRNSSSTTGSNYELETKTPKKSGTVIGSVTLIARESSQLGEEGYIRLIRTALTTSKLIELQNSQLKVSVSNEKSSNNYLSSLSSNIATINFDKDVTQYTVDVDSNLKTFDLVATPEDTASNVTISDQNLNKKKNVITITVMSEDGTERVYKVNVNKKEEKEIIEKTSKIDTNAKKNGNVKSGWYDILVILITILVLDVIYIKKRK